MEWLVPNEWREYASGFSASMVNIAVTYPVHKAMFRQMVHGFSAAEAGRQLHREGLAFLYRGALPPLILKSCSSSIMFGTYAQYTRLLMGGQQSGRSESGRSDHRSRSRTATVYVRATAAFLAGSTEALLTPIERVQVLLQDHKHHENYRNTADALAKLKSTRYGVREYYRGLSAVLLRNGPSNVIFFYARDKVKERLNDDGVDLDDGGDPASRRHGGARDLVADFLTGAFTGGVISTLFYPANVVRTHMQLVVGQPFKSFFRVWADLAWERGLWGLFKGVHLNYTRSFMSWGIINMTYEQVYKRL